jgi:hypothetical protein
VNFQKAQDAERREKKEAIKKRDKQKFRDEFALLKKRKDYE